MNKADLPDQLTGTRILLTRADPPSDDACATMIADWPRFARFFPELAPEIDPDASTLGARFHELLVQRRVAFEEYAWELRMRTTNDFLGHASVHALMWKHGCAELAYWLREEAEGQGFVAEAVGVLERMLFERGFQRVEIRCDAQNAMSAAVARRCGYVLDGTLRAHMRRLDGSYRSSLVFGKLREDAAPSTQVLASPARK